MGLLIVFKKLWRWLQSLWRRWQRKPVVAAVAVELPVWSDATYEFFLFDLLKGVCEQGWERDAVLVRPKRLRLAYNLKEEFRNIFETCKTPEDGQEKLKAWLEKAKPVYGEVLETIRNHLDNICNYFLNRTSSGVMEGLNNRIKLIKRQAYGFLNFINFRSRLLACLSH